MLKIAKDLIATSTGDTDTAFSIQPSKVVIRWHRTA